MNEQTVEALIQHRVRGGGNEAESRKLLTETLRVHGKGTLAAALVYLGFAKSGAACRIVDTLGLEA